MCLFPLSFIPLSSLKKKKRQKQNKTLYFLHLSPAGSRDVLIHFRASLFLFCLSDVQHFPGGSDGKESSWNSGDSGSIPGLGRSPGEGKGYPLQDSGPENSMACIVHRVAKSQTQLSDFHFHFSHVTSMPAFWSVFIINGC